MNQASDSGDWDRAQSPGIDVLLANLTRPGVDDIEVQSVEQQVVLQVAIESIQVNRYQPRSRFDEEALSSLTNSVRELGVLQPLLVRAKDDGQYELIAGERRWRAARRAGLSSVPVLIRTVSDRRSLEEAIVENLHRVDLNSLEEAAAYRQLVEDFEMTQNEVATRVGRSRSAVANTLRLLQLPSLVQRMLVDGELTTGHARCLLALSSCSDQRALAVEIVEQDLTVRQAEDLVKKRLGSQSETKPEKINRSGPGSKSSAALEVEFILAERLNTKVEVSDRAGVGSIVINFADNEDLERILEILMGESD